MATKQVTNVTDCECKCNCDEMQHQFGDMQGIEKASLLPNTDMDAKKSHGFFFDHENGVYFTYEKREIKIAACRMVMKTLLLLSAFALYFLLWGVCDICILLVAAASCGGVCIGMDFLSTSCVAGVLAALFRGFRLGNEIAAVEIHWKM